MGNKDAFTLIEMLIVVLIIAILAAVALPQYNAAIERSKISEAITILRQISQANRRYYLAAGSYVSQQKTGDLDLTITGTVREDFNNRIEANNFIFGASAGSGIFTAIAFRKPAAPQNFCYYLAILQSSDNLTCEWSGTNCANASIQKKLCNAIHAKGSL